MATTDFVYGNARVAIGSGSIDLLTATIWAMLVNGNYTPNPNSDQYVAIIAPSAILARVGPLTSLGLTSAGVFYGTVPPFVSLSSVNPAVALILYINSGTDATSQLLYYTSGGYGFPFTPAGFTYSIPFDQVNGGYFQI